MLADAPEIDGDLDEALVEKEPITVILSEKGWIRALKGHQEELGKLDFKQGDSLKRAIHAQTTDKLVLFATNGKFFTLDCASLPGGRGHGEPLRLLVDLEDNHDIVGSFVHDPERKLLVASTTANGFIVPEAEVVALTRKGKQVLNLSEPEEAAVCVPAAGDMVAVIGENRKLVIFPLAEVNEMTRGKGIRLQKYKDGGISDARVFAKKDGLTWLDAAGRTFTLSWAGGEGLGRPARAIGPDRAQGLPALEQVRTGVRVSCAAPSSTGAACRRRMRPLRCATLIG